MKKIISIITLFLCTYTLSATCVAAEQSLNGLDQIVAVINDEVITQSELTKQLNTAKAQAEAQQVALPDAALFRKTVLDQLINKKLQLQIAKQAGLIATQAEVTQAVDSVAKRNNISVNALYDHVAATGLSKTAYQHELRDQISIQKIEQQQVGGQLAVSPDEVTDYIRSQKWHDNSTEAYQLEDILVPLSEVPSPQEIIAANNRAKAVVDQLHQGASIQSLIQASVTDNPPLQGGDLGFRNLADIPTLFAEQVVHMQPHQVAGPIQAPNGFHIIRLVATRTAAMAANGKPDRKQVEEILLQQKFQTAAETWVSKVRAQSFVKIYS